MNSRWRRVFAVIIAMVGLTGCGDGPSQESVDVVVSAASSLTDVFRSMERAFESENVGVDVVLNLGGSAVLREQIVEGAPVDVFASANLEIMDAVDEAGLVAGSPIVFATNSMQLAVPTGNPAAIDELSDLADESLLVGLCAEGVPCGQFARQVLDRAGVTPSVDTNEPDVRALLTKIEAGELDVGITYATDVTASDEVDGVEIPIEFNVVADYPIAALSEARQPDLAARFVDFVLSDQGAAILEEYGFQPG